MGWWRERVVPWLAEASLSSREVGEYRRRTCAPLTGRVLEVGFGSGLNTMFYPAAVTHVSAVEPSDVAWRISQRRREATAVPVERTGLDGQRLEQEDSCLDAALVTFTLCTIPDVAAALAEVRRVLRPGGSLCFLEHGLAPDPAVARWQRRLDGTQRFLAGGCHLTRDVPALLAGAGFEVHTEPPEYLPGPAVSRPWTCLYLGRATPRAR